MYPYFAAIALTVGLALIGRAQLGRVRVVHGAAENKPESVRSGDRAGSHAFFAFAASAVLILMAALRWRRGTDYWVYESLYSSEYILLPWSQMRIFEEPGIRAVAKIAQVVHDDPAAMFALASLITVGLSTYTIVRNTSHLPLALYLYVTSTAWQGSFNGVRQYVACAIVFAGHRLILERRFWPYLAVVFLASLFHISAWVTLLLYWVPRRQLRPLQVVGLLVSALIVLNSYEYISEVLGMIKAADLSMASYFVERVNPLRVLVALAPVALFLMFTVRTDLTEAGSFYANLMYLHALVMLAALNSAYVARFAIYTGIFIALAVPALLNMKDRRLRGLLSFVVVVGFGVYWYLETTPVGLALDPYRSVFDR